jgi:ABC-type sugar transport systems, permease components
MSRDSRSAYFMLAPALGFLGVTTAVTLGYMLWTSTQRKVQGLDSFVLLGNYASVLQDHAFWDALLRSALYVGFAVGAELIIGLALALLLRRQIRGVGLVRSLIIVPMMIPPIVAGLIWKILYDPSFGILNYALSAVGVDGPVWVGNASTALPSLIIVDIWQWTPFMVLVLLAGLSSLPEEPVEAACVDGANSWQVFRFVTLPGLRRIIDVLILFRALDALKSFDTIFTLTQGGPGRATETIVYDTYLTAFRYYEVGKAASMAVLLLLLTILASNVYVRLRHVDLVGVA